MENPIDEATTVAEMLRRPAVSADPQVVGTAQRLGTWACHFEVVMGPLEHMRMSGETPTGRRGSGRNDQTDHRYESVVQAGMKRPEAAYNLNATKTNAPIRTIVPATMTTAKNPVIPANAGMTGFVAGRLDFFVTWAAVDPAMIPTGGFGKRL